MQIVPGQEKTLPAVFLGRDDLKDSSNCISKALFRSVARQIGQRYGQRQKKDLATCSLGESLENPVLSWEAAECANIGDDEGE